MPVVDTLQELGWQTCTSGPILANGRSSAWYVRALNIGSILVSFRNPSSIDQSHLSKLWLPAGKKSLCRAKEAKYIGWNAISEPISYHLTMIWLFSSFFLISDIWCLDLCQVAYQPVNNKQHLEEEVLATSEPPKYWLLPLKALFSSDDSQWVLPLD